MPLLISNIRSLFPVLLTSVSVFAQPVVISTYQSGISQAYKLLSNDGVTNPTLTLHLPFTFVGGPHNCAIMAVHQNGALTMGTPTDNTLEHWTAGPSIISDKFSNGGTLLKIWYVIGDTAGTSTISIPTTGTAVSEQGAWVTEVKNCSGVGGSGTVDEAGPKVSLDLSSAPSMGDMVWAAFMDTSASTYAASGGLPVYLSSITPGNTFTSLSLSTSLGKMAEYSTVTTSKVVPVTFSGIDQIGGLAIVIKKGPVGRSPSGKYIDHLQVDQYRGNNITTLPSSGNLLIGLVSTTTASVQSVRASTGSWVASSECKNTNNAVAQVIYGYGATGKSTTVVTPMWNSTPISPGTEIEWISVTNAANSSAVLDKCVSGSGSQLITAPLSTVSVTPSAVNELVVNMDSISWHTLNASVKDSKGHLPKLLSANVNKEDDAEYTCDRATPPSMLDEDNGWAYFYNTDVQPITFIFQGTQTAAGGGRCVTNPKGVLYWGGIAAVFK